MGMKFSGLLRYVGFFTEKRNMKLLDRRIKEAGDLPGESLLNARVLASRYEAVKLMPKGMVAAEVGVAYGDFSDFIIKTMQPSHFYAIDFFNKNNPQISFWERNDFKEAGMTHEDWYRKRFADLIRADKMTVCSGLSWDCLEQFEDDFFDYLYIDAGHDYESVKRDIEVAVRKVKHNGYIQFNDYILWDMFLGEYYGVVPAVNEMVRRTKSQILYYCFNLYRFDDIVVRLNKRGNDGENVYTVEVERELQRP